MTPPAPVPPPNDPRGWLARLREVEVSERSQVDTAFLVGVRYGRSSERERVAAAIEEVWNESAAKGPMFNAALMIAAAIARSAPSTTEPGDER